MSPLATKRLMLASLACSIGAMCMCLVAIVLLALMEREQAIQLNLEVVLTTATTALFLAGPTLWLGWVVMRRTKGGSDPPSAQLKAGLQLAWCASLVPLFYIVIAAGLGQVTSLITLSVLAFGATAVALLASIFVKTRPAE